MATIWQVYYIVLILTTVLQARLDRYLHFIKKEVERCNNSPSHILPGLRTPCSEIGVLSTLISLDYK